MRWKVVIRQKTLFGERVAIDSIESFTDERLARDRARKLREGRSDLAISLRRMGRRIIPMHRAKAK